MLSELSGPQVIPDSPEELARRGEKFGLRMTGVKQIRQEYTVIPAEVADNIERREILQSPVRRRHTVATGSGTGDHPIALHS